MLEDVRIKTLFSFAGLRAWFCHEVSQVRSSGLMSKRENQDSLKFLDQATGGGLGEN